MVTSLKRSQACTATVHALNSAAGHHQPTPSPETPGHHRQVSYGVAVPSSLVLVYKTLLCPPRVYFPVLSKFWQLCGGVNGNLVLEDLCHTHTQSPCPCGRPLPTCTSTGDAHSSVSVSVGSLGPGAHKVYLSPLSISGGNGV